MKKVKLFFVILIAVMILAATPVNAADSREKSGTLNINHRLGTVENNTGTPGKEKPITIDSKLEYDIHKNEVIQIRVDDPNPFIYNYKFKGIQKTETEDYTAIEKFLEAIEPFFKAVDKTNEQKTAKNAAIEKINAEITELKCQIKQIKPNTNTANLLYKKTEVEITGKYKEIQSLEKFYENLGLDNNFFKNLSKNLRDLKKIAKKIPDYIIGTTIKSNMTQIANEIKIWDPDLKNKFIEAYKLINKAQEDFLSQFDDMRNDKEQQKDFFLISTMISFAQDQKATIMELLDKVESFKNTFNKMNSEDKGIILGTISYDEKEKITATVEISYINIKLESEVEEYLNKYNMNIPKTGSFDFIFEPYIAFKYQFGVSQILSTFKNVDENGKEKNFQLQVPTLTIIPHQWDDWKVKPNFQLGFTVKDDLKHLILGPGIKLFDSFYVGGGAHLRWGKDSLLRLGGYLNLSFTPLKLN